MRTVISTMMMAIVLCGGYLSAFDDSPKCFNELETNFFDERIVSQALSLYNVSQSQWSQISRDLRSGSTLVPKLIRDASRRMARDPLDRPFQPKEASQLLFGVLYGVFSQVLHEYDITRESDIRGMFDFVKQQQEAKIKECFPEEALTQELQENRIIAGPPLFQARNLGIDEKTMHKNQKSFTLPLLLVF